MSPLCKAQMSPFLEYKDFLCFVGGGCGVGDGGDLQQLVPVGVVAAQTRDLKTQREADFASGDTRHEVAIAAAVGALRAGLALVVVNGTDALIGPAERDRALTQTVLAPRAFGILRLHVQAVHGSSGRPPV